jgi:aspartate 1-decarboxylase
VIRAPRSQTVPLPVAGDEPAPMAACGMPVRLRTYVHAKIHGLVVTAASIEYHGSVSIGSDLMDHAGIEPYEQVDVVDLNNGNRWTTYALPGPDGVFTLNGGGARLGCVGDVCVVMAYETSGAYQGGRVLFPRYEGGLNVPDTGQIYPAPLTGDALLRAIAAGQV